MSVVFFLFFNFFEIFQRVYDATLFAREEWSLHESLVNVVVILCHRHVRIIFSRFFFEDFLLCKFEDVHANHISVLRAGSLPNSHLQDGQQNTSHTSWSVSVSTSRLVGCPFHSHRLQVTLIGLGIIEIVSCTELLMLHFDNCVD